MSTVSSSPTPTPHPGAVTRPQQERPLNLSPTSPHIQQAIEKGANQSTDQVNITTPPEELGTYEMENGEVTFKTTSSPPTVQDEKIPQVPDVEVGPVTINSVTVNGLDLSNPKKTVTRTATDFATNGNLPNVKRPTSFGIGGTF